MKIKRCFLDLDGVITNFNGAAVKIHNLEEVSKSWPKGYWNWHTLSGMSHDDFFRPMEYDFWFNMEMLPDADVIIKMVEEKFGQQNICILTSPTANVGCPGGKRAWVERHLPDYRKRLLIGSAKEFCAYPGSLLIDDSPDNVDKFNAGGGATILVPRYWNHLHSLVAVHHLEQELIKYEI